MSIKCSLSAVPDDMPPILIYARKGGGSCSSAVLTSVDVILARLHVQGEGDVSPALALFSMPRTEKNSSDCLDIKGQIFKRCVCKKPQANLFASAKLIYKQGANWIPCVKSAE
ncbi:hypothetical protein ATANTOWER_020123 [Ataeniobius toweri]|uniref:Uncharacterized protein n=1 Tax=Ataeniobius toweri TaxID=208326 RepID=A0ABU7CLT2_9TELE|nr:hypothetical protein [Ataeniobius toweri]